MTHIETLEKTENTNVRESNLELLRIIATIFVILLHYNDDFNYVSFLNQR